MCRTTLRSASKQIASTVLPSDWGPIKTLGFERAITCACGTRLETAMVLIVGNISHAPLVRIHSQCLTGDVFGSLRCDCGGQLKLAMNMIREEGAGILIYEQQEGRGIGLLAKLCAYALQDQGLDTVQANQFLGLEVDCRDYLLATDILRHLQVNEVRLLSNNPRKSEALHIAGIKVLQRIPCEVIPTAFAADYLLTKKQKMGHQLTLI